MLHNKVGKALSYGVVKDSRTEQQTDLLRTIEREIASLKRQFTPNNQLALLTTISANDASSEEAISPLSTALKVLAIALTVLSAALSNNLTSRPLDMLSRLWLLRHSEMSRRAIEDVPSGFNILETSISADGCLLSIVPNSEQGQNMPLSKEPHKADDSVDALRPRNHEVAKEAIKRLPGPSTRPFLVSPKISASTSGLTTSVQTMMYRQYGVKTILVVT